jgi:small subunit ribosomal protein S6
VQERNNYINFKKGKSSMLNQYETVFIATPVLSDAQFKEVVAKFSGLVSANNAELIHEEDWGLKKLAYPIQKKSTGFYHLIEFKADPSFIEKFETEYRRDERIIRFLTFKLDKHAVEYSAKRRIKVKAKAEEK